MNSSYLASQLSQEGESLRERSFTRWMTRDLLQAATGFLSNLRLVALYAECSEDRQYRYLLWNPPPKCKLEVRSGRTREQFEGLDRINLSRGWPLLTLHISETEVFSAVWIGPEHFAIAVQILAAYGISPAQSVPAQGA